MSSILNDSHVCLQEFYTFVRNGEEGKPSQKMCGVHKKGHRKETQHWGSVVFTRMLQGPSYTPQLLNHLLPLLRYRAFIL
jgi:hypothetical protein